jgi:lactate 2-monooxygenase
MSKAVDRQRDIYLNGAAGRKSKIPVDTQALENKAKDIISAEAFAYIAGGAGKELTMAQNRADFTAWQILPRMLQDVSERDTSIHLLGKHYPSPFLLAPIGVLEMAHPDADLAVAKAAAQLQMPYIFSNQASVHMEKTASAMGTAPRWFQLYWSKSNELVESFVQRAEASGCEAIVVTLDTTLLGWRTRDLDLAYLPFLRGMGIAQYTHDPVFRQLLEQPDETPGPKVKPGFESLVTLYHMCKRYPGPFWQNLKSGIALKAVRKFIQIYSRPSLTWEDLQFLRGKTSLPILLKGILHPDDAVKAISHGINGIIISNHGGRQVDGSASTISMLPEIAAAVNGQIPLIVDSGIRTGADAFKALALGASAVCIGRPYVYGLAIDGEQGVYDVLSNFWADFELTMGLAGCKNVGEINRACLRKTNG